jgi:hypothetical protein
MDPDLAPFRVAMENVAVLDTGFFCALVPIVRLWAPFREQVKLFVLTVEDLLEQVGDQDFFYNFKDLGFR